jgi:hypothetical protein
MHIGALLRVWQRRQDLRDPRNGAYDKIVMRGGHDLVLANGYTNDTDTIQGGSGFDKINVADGDNFDKAGGGRGGDWCIVDSRREAGVGCSRVTVRESALQRSRPLQSPHFSKKT